MTPLARYSPPDAGRDPATIIAAGDLVRTGENRYSQYLVIALIEDRAWVRDVQLGTDHVIGIEGCRKIDAAERALVGASRE